MAQPRARRRAAPDVRCTGAPQRTAAAPTRLLDCHRKDDEALLRMETPGNLFCVAAPSGAGKSSLVKALLELDSHLLVSVSHTTRAPRGQEVDGREYRFIDEPTFRAMVGRGEFFEWAQVHGNLYGTSRKAIEERLMHGQDVVLEIDWQGALQIKQLFPHAVLIFILPPSWQELEQRLRRRGEDQPEVIATRLANAREEVAQARHFDYVVVNAVFETALFDLKAVVHSQRLKFAAQKRVRSQVFQALGLA
jgi:guanylate kinase